MDLDLNGRAALVTGGSQGIALAVVSTLIASDFVIGGGLLKEI